VLSVLLKGIDSELVNNSLRWQANELVILIGNPIGKLVAVSVQFRANWWHLISSLP
jgi:hypothetical protein